MRRSSGHASRAEACSHLPVGVFGQGLRGPVGKSSASRGLAPQAPGPYLDWGVATPWPKLTEVWCLVPHCSGRKVHPEPPDLTEATLSRVESRVKSELCSPGEFSSCAETEAQRGAVIFPGFHSWSPGVGFEQQSVWILSPDVPLTIAELR